MQIYAAGWCLQSPAINYFKKFLKINASRVFLKGIIYPKKIPASIEEIPVLDFDEFIDLPATHSSKIIECHLPDNKTLSEDFHQYFTKIGLTVVKISDFCNQIVDNDLENKWILPFNGISTSDIRRIRKIDPPSFLAENFFDTKSSDIFQALDNALRHSRWDSMMSFDKGETLDEALLESLLLMQKAVGPHNYRILEAPQIFLNALLKLKHRPDHHAFKIIMTRDKSALLGEQLAFYQKCFKNDLVIEEYESPNLGGTIYLSNTATPILQRASNDLTMRNAIFIMRRSIIDHHTLIHSSGHRKFRIALRQPDTQYQHLVASFIA